MSKKQLVDLVHRLKGDGNIDAREAYWLLLTVMHSRESVEQLLAAREEEKRRAV